MICCLCLLPLLESVSIHDGIVMQVSLQPLPSRIQVSVYLVVIAISFQPDENPLVWSQGGRLPSNIPPRQNSLIQALRSLMILFRTSYRNDPS
jgi:hypothetical protein